MSSRRTSVAALFVAVCVGVGGCSRPDAPPPPPPPPPDKVDLDTVNDALHLCLTLDCERAYAHATSALPPASELRKGDAFRALAYRYYAERLLRADIEPDLTKRRADLQSVLEAPDVDTSLKLAASERLSRVGAQLGAAREFALNATTTAPSEAASAAAGLLAKSRSMNPADQSEVRAKLEPKIFAGKATAEDVALLKTVCKSQKDAACLRQLDHLILP